MKIQGLSSKSIIEEFEIIKEVSNHDICRFKVSLYEDDDFINIKTNQYIEISKDLDIVFKGLVQNFIITKNHAQTTMEVEVYSTSIVEDIQKKCRVFQNTEKTCFEIYEKLNKDNRETKIDYVDDEEIDYSIVQIEETNFEFIKKLAYKQGLSVWINKFDKISIRNTLGHIKNDLDNKDIKTYIHNETVDFIKIEIESDRELKIGHSIMYLNKNYTITRHHLIKEYGIYKNIYTLTLYKDSKNLSQESYLEEVLKICEADVIDNDDPEKLGRVRLSFADNVLEEVNPQNQVWCDVNTIYSTQNGGMYFVPEVGDVVKVEIYEDKMIVIGVVRLDSPEEPLQDIGNKSISKNTQNYISFTDEIIEINNTNSKTQIHKDKIVVTIGESTIDISKECIIVNNPKLEINSDNVVFNIKEKLEINNETLLINTKKKAEIINETLLLNTKNKAEITNDNLSIKTNDKLSIKANSLETNSSNVEIKSSGKVKINGSKIELS